MTKRWTVSKNLVFNVHRGHIVIFDSENGKLFTVNQIAKEILELINAGKTVEEVIDTIKTSYNVSSHIVENDVKNLIEELTKYKIIQEVT